MRHAPDTPETARQVLRLIDQRRADATTDWWQILSACRNCGLSFDEALQWSLTERHHDREQIRRAWENSRSKAGLGTLLHYAKLDGADLSAIDMGMMDGTGLGGRAPSRLWPSPRVHQPRVRDGKVALTAILAKALPEADDVELWERSPYRLDWEPGVQDIITVIDILYGPDDLLSMGPVYPNYPPNLRGGADQIGDSQIMEREAFKLEWQRRHILPAAEWIRRLRADAGALLGLPLIRPNPLSGNCAATADGRKSYIADNCVAKFAFAVVEFDHLSLPEQVAFWITMVDQGWPVATLIHSGNKSIHGCVAVNCADRNEWEREVEQRLFGDYLAPLGVDPQCRNESRMSRCPGHVRTETGKIQRLLYLNPEHHTRSECQ